MNILCILLVIVNVILGQTGYEIAKMVEDRATPKDQSSKTTMILINSKGRTRTSTIYSKTLSGGEKQILWFMAPADDKGVAFLKIEHDEKDDEMQMWLPAFKKVRRISAKKRSDSFMGSDMSYEDMSTRQLDEFNFNILGNEIYQDIPCHLLESTPKEHIRTEYSRHITWVDSTLFIPLKEESYDKSGTLLKEKNFSYTVIKDYQILTDILVTNIQKNHTTSLTFENIELDSGVEDNLFHERYLKRLP